MFSTSTIASSTSRPITSDKREQRDRVHREAEPVHRRERRDDRQRQRRRADTSVARQSRRNQPDDQRSRGSRPPTACSSTRDTGDALCHAALTSSKERPGCLRRSSVERAGDAGRDLGLVMPWCRARSGSARTTGLPSSSAAACARRSCRRRRDLVEPQIDRPSGSAMSSAARSPARSTVASVRTTCSVPPISAATAGRFLLHALELPGHVGRAEVERRELVPDRVRSALRGRRRRRVRHVPTPGTRSSGSRHRIVDEPRQRLLVHRSARDRERQDRAARPMVILVTSALRDPAGRSERMFDRPHRLHVVERFEQVFLELELDHDRRPGHR